MINTHIHQHNVIKIEIKKEFFEDNNKEKEFYTIDFIFTDKNENAIKFSAFSKEKLEIKDITEVKE